MKERKYIFDYIRVLACLFVILFHTANYGGGTIPESIIRTIDTIGLPMFFLLSGVLCLNSDKTLAVCNFYIHRFIKIVIPFLLYGILYTTWINTGLPLAMIPTKTHLILAAKLIPYATLVNIAGSQYFHLWFVYTMIGLYILMPFLKRMLDTLSEKQLYSLCFIALVMQGMTDYLPQFGIQVGIENHFCNWIIYLIFGYTISQPFMNKKKYMFTAVLGLLSTLFSFFISQYHPSHITTYFYDLDPHMILIVCGTYSIFMLLESQITHFDKLNKFITWLSGYCFSIYLIHGYFASNIYTLLPNLSGNVWLGSIERQLSIFAFSFVYAFLFDNVITKNVMRLANLIYQKCYQLYSNHVN